jgi:hypothetical protein
VKAPWSIINFIVLKKDFSPLNGTDPVTVSCVPFVVKDSPLTDRPSNSNKEQVKGSQNIILRWIMAFTVWVTQLQSEDGAPYRGVEGIESDEERVQFSEAVAETTNRTIADLKLLIIQQFFPGQQKSTSRIKVYLFSNAASGDARADGPDVQSPTDALLDGRRYGFIDLDFARPRGVLPRVQGGGLYRINDERVRCKFTIQNHVSSSECLMMPAEIMVDAGAQSELKLPGRKVVQLGLMPIGGPRQVRGSTNHFGEVLNFSGAIVSATFDRDGSSETVEALLFDGTRQFTRIRRSVGQ